MKNATLRRSLRVKSTARTPQIDALEQRLLLSVSRPDGRFAVLAGAVNVAGRAASTPFRIDPASFVLPASQRLLLGFQVPSANSLRVVPQEGAI